MIRMCSLVIFAIMNYENLFALISKGKIVKDEYSNIMEQHLIQKVNPSMDRISSKCIDEFKVPKIEIDPYCKISFQFQFKMNSIIKFLYTSILAKLRM